MKFKVGQKVFIKPLVASYSEEFRKLYKKGDTGKIIKIDDETVSCVECNFSHGPRILVLTSKGFEHSFTECELEVYLIEKLDKILNL